MPEVTPEWSLVNQNQSNHLLEVVQELQSSIAKTQTKDTTATICKSSISSPVSAAAKRGGGASLVKKLLKTSVKSVVPRASIPSIHDPNFDALIANFEATYGQNKDKYHQVKSPNRDYKRISIPLGDNPSVLRRGAVDTILRLRLSKPYGIQFKDVRQGGTECPNANVVERWRRW